MERVNLSNEHVVITGASSGLGEALALELATHGARITLLARRQDQLNTVAESVRARGGDALAIATDVTVQKDLDKAIERAVAQFGPVGILIANAGISPGMSALELDVPLIDNAMQLNFFGVVYAVNAVLPSMIERKSGLILAISSSAAFRGLPTMAPYCASKSAVSAWMESLRSELDLEETGVRIVTSHPGFIKTPMTENTESDMPFLVQAEDAARILVQGMVRGGSQINFPWPFIAMLKFAGRLPNRMYDQAVWSSVSDPVTLNVAARDACWWILGGVGLCVTAWSSLRFVLAPTAETLTTIYWIALPVLAASALFVAGWLRRSTKVPSLIALFTIPLGILVGLVRFFSH